MTITVEAAYSVPESWNPSGTQYMYTATMPIPLTAEVRTHFLSFILFLIIRVAL